MNLLDALTFQPPKVEKKAHRNKHKPGTKCANCDNPRHITKSGRVNTYCKLCAAEIEREAYKRRKEEELKKSEIQDEYAYTSHRDGSSMKFASYARYDE